MGKRRDFLWRAASVAMSLAMVFTMMPKTALAARKEAQKKWPQKIQKEEEEIEEIDEEAEVVVNEFALTYDEHNAFPTTRLTGKQVSEALFASVTCYKRDGDYDETPCWYVYGEKGNASMWTGLWYSYASAGEEEPEYAEDDEWYKGFKSLAESDALLTADREYYFSFDICPDGSILNQDNPVITVNGKPAEIIRKIGDELVVFQRVTFNETEDSIYRISLNPESATVKKGSALRFTAKAFGTNPDAEISYRVEGASAKKTAISSKGLLKIAENESAEDVTVVASHGAVETRAKVFVLDEDPYLGDVEITDIYRDAETLVIRAEVGGNLLPVTLLYSVSGNTDEGTYFKSATQSIYPDCRYAEGYLLLGPNETSEEMIIRVTCKEDPTKYAEETIKTSDYLVTNFNVTYDRSKVHLDKNHTGSEVSTELFEAVTCDRYGDEGNEGDEWYVYGNMGTFSEWTGLWYASNEKDNEYDDEWRKGFVSLADDNDKLKGDKQYYFSFNICPNNKILNTVHPNVTVNGKPADVVRVNDIELVVFQKVTFGAKITPLEITKQPRDWYGTFGKKASFTVEATGDDLSYQWQYKKSGNWVNYGVTTADTAIFKVTMNEKNIKWPIRCVISDANGQQAITREVRMKDASVSAPITITSQPSDWTGALGKKASFSVEASGNGLTYQWQYKKGTKWNPYTVTSATTAILKVTMNEVNVNYPIRCKITDEDGFIAYTNEVYMKIKEAEPLAITSQPTDWYGNYGQKASFNVTATGEGLTYQWQYKKGTADWTNYAITTADTANFKVTMNEKNVKWTFRCVITDASGNTVTSDEVRMKLKEALAITSQPCDWYGKYGQKASFNVTATGEGLTYQWQYKKGTADWTNYAIATADTANFKVTMNEKNVKWTYRCVITDANGNTVTTNEVRMVLSE